MSENWPGATAIVSIIEKRISANSEGMTEPQIKYAVRQVVLGVAAKLPPIQASELRILIGEEKIQ